MGKMLNTDWHFFERQPEAAMSAQKRRDLARPGGLPFRQSESDHAEPNIFGVPEARVLDRVLANHLEDGEPVSRLLLVGHSELHLTIRDMQHWPPMTAVDEISDHGRWKNEIFH